MLASYVKSRSATFLLTIFLVLSAVAQAQSGSSTSITGTVVDPSGAVVTNATVEVRNPVSGFSRNAVTDSAGKFVLPNVPFNPYQVTVIGQGFAPYSGDVDVRSTVPAPMQEFQTIPTRCDFRKSWKTGPPSTREKSLGSCRSVGAFPCLASFFSYVPATGSLPHAAGVRLG